MSPPMQAGAIAGAILLVAAAFVWWRGRGILFRPSWESISAMVRRSFPEVRQIEPGALAARQTGGNVIVVDCRGAKDFAFSHIPGAVNCRSVEEVTRVAQRDQPVVVYCVIGYRASMLADRLSKAGYRDVGSLEGAILRWANEDRPLVDCEGRPAEKVSPWLKSWAKHLLKPGKF
jgi:rhodanese-related sulfurtransferase